MTFSMCLICNGIHVWIDLQQVTIKPKESSFFFFHNLALMPIYKYIYVYKPRPTTFIPGKQEMSIFQEWALGPSSRVLRAQV